MLRPESRPQREDIEKLLHEADDLQLSQGVREKLQWFLYALDHDNDPQKVGEEFKISPSTFRRWLKRFDPDDPSSLEEKSRRPHAVREPDTLPQVVELIRQYRRQYPTMGKERIQEVLQQEHAITLSPSTIGRIIRRERLFFADTLSHLHKRTTPPPPPPPPSPPLPKAGATTLLLLLVTAAAAFLSGTPQAEALQSASFRLYEVFPNEVTESPSDSTSFKLNENVITWTSLPLAGSSFQVTPTPPTSSSSSTTSSSSSSSSSSSVTSSSSAVARVTGGRRGHGPSPKKPQPKEVPLPLVPPQPSSLPEIRSSEPSSLPWLSRPEQPIPVKPGLLTPRLPAHPLFPRGPLSPVRSPLVSGDQLQREAATSIGQLSLILMLGGFAVGIGTRRLYSVISASGSIGGTGRSYRRQMRKARRSRKGWRNILLIICLLSGAVAILLTQAATAATTVPNAYVYNGHLLDSSGSAITTSHTIRFSYWKSADYVSTDTTATGAINTGASNYANWNEVDTVTPDSNGYFSVRLGSGTSLPSLANYSPAELQNLFLQVEVKSASDPDTSYEILDSDTARTTVDRSPILSVPFALNADRLDQRDTGTGSGSIPVLLTGGLLPVSAIPGGTNEITFIIDKNTTSSTDITLMFGGSLAKRLWYDTITNQFNFDDDLHVTGNITGSGTFTVAGAAIFGSTVQLNGVTYTFPASDGTASGKILKTNGAGQLVWGNAGRSSGAIIGLRPEYPNSVYFGSGANAVGTLSLRHSSGGTVTNYYRWQSTKTTNQHYWIATQIRLPDTFQTWEASKPLQLQYRTSSGSIAVFMQDTASNPVTLSGNTNLQSSTWATATITGPNTSGTWTPGGDFTIFLRLTNSGATILDRTYTDLGSLNINVEEGLP